jgi:ribonuclease Y
MEVVIVGIIALIVGAVSGVGLYHSNQSRRGKTIIQTAQDDAQRLTSETQTRLQKEELEAKNRLLHEKEDAEALLQRRRAELEQEEDRLQRRRDSLDEKLEKLERREQAFGKQQSLLDKKKNEIDKLWSERSGELERMAQMTQEEARQELLKVVEENSRNDMARRIMMVEEEMQFQADQRARNVIALAIQRLASESVNEMAVSVVAIPSEEAKGRIIGRAGRNIRAFEQATGVDVVVDDTPEAITLSSFDPVRREVAKRVMAKLVLDGRIHPGRIEKLVAETKREVERIIRDEGERACFEANVTGLHKEVQRLVGTLKFRSSYGQNVLAHSIETANLAGMIAAELGADVAIARAGGLLHDIGKAIDHEVEGPHAIIGAEFAKRFKVIPKVVNCIASHHQEVEQETVEAMIVAAADAISGARPGARRDSVDGYIKRVKMLEDLAQSFPGVDQTYALQAGREVRILVKPEEIDDLASQQLANDIARQIEESMSYPGQIKVIVVRETRMVATAH